MDRMFETILESGFKRCGFGEWIHWFCVDERSINVEKNISYVVPKISALMWICKSLFLGKITIFSYPAQVLEVAVHLLHNV